LLELWIQGVKDAQGKDLYVADSRGQGESGSRVWLRHDGQGRLQGIRRVALRAGLAPGTIAFMQGEVRLNMPGELQKVALGTDALGHVQQVNPGFSVTLTRMEGEQVDLTASGEGELAAVVALNSSGETMESIGYTAIEINNAMEYKAQFPRPVSRVILSVASGIQSSRHPFLLRPGQPLILNP
jgi:hypothetical protein